MASSAVTATVPGMPNGAGGICSARSQLWESRKLNPCGYLFVLWILVWALQPESARVTPCPKSTSHLAKPKESVA